ncbi:MAG: OmpA family protein [Geminicoccaceae bacterium]
MRILGILICLVALGLAGYSAFTYKAPQIQADIEKRMATALSILEADDVEVSVDGRHVTLEGRVADDNQRQEVLRVAAAVPGVIGPIDALEQLPLASPYRFDAQKDEDGNIVVEGHAPTDEVKAAIEASARALFGDDASVAIELAGGAPSAEWQDVVTSAMDALATTHQGSVAISNRDIMLDGDVALEADVDAVAIFAQSMPEGYRWTDLVSVLREEVSPFTFSVVKEADGHLNLSGYAPDDATKAALIDAGKAVAGDRPITADIQVADGMPDAEWPALVQAGISAMNDMEAGRFDVVDNDVAFTNDPTTEAADAEPDTQPTSEPASIESIETVASEVTDDVAEVAEITETETADPADITETAGPAELLKSDVDVDQPGETEMAATTETADVPPADSDTSVDAALAPVSEEPELPPLTLTVDKAQEGSWSVRGTVPDQDSRNTLVGALQSYLGVDSVDVELELTGGDPDERWLRFVNDRIASLDIIQAGRLQFEGDKAHLIGVVETPEDVEPVEAALAAIDQGMTVDLQPIDPRPIASLDLKLSAVSGVVLNGSLPEGMAENDALSALGIQGFDGELDVNGRGPIEPWRQNLAAIGDVLPAFDEVTISLGGDRPKIRGSVPVHDDADAIARKVVLAFNSGPQPLVDIAPSTAAFVNGTRRANPLTRQEEDYRQGYWLPVIEIVAGEAACNERAAAMLAADKIMFLRGEDDLDEQAETALDALAGLAHACLDGSGLVLEIGGHTDARGTASLNEELSQARADVVRNALSARGVDPASLVAVGYGDAQPVADNATEEGRAANRRITFDWKASADLESSEVEG